MQEAKYCEDIVPAIKAALEAAGFVNEHDRLGHFESVVPADTFFGLGTQRQSVRLFGLQFKAPTAQLTWDMTHTPGQFDSIRLLWPNLIYYALPWYTELVDSSRGLELCAFLSPSALPDHPSRIARNELPLPEEYVARLLCAYCGDPFAPTEFDLSEGRPRAYRMILQQGPARFIQLCVEARTRDYFPVLDLKEIPQEYVRSIGIHFRDAAWEHVRDWNGNGVKCEKGRHFGDRMTVRTIMKTRFVSSADPLEFEGRLRATELEMVSAGAYLTQQVFEGVAPLSDVLSVSGRTPYSNWDSILEGIRTGDIGIEMSTLERRAFVDQFRDQFADNEAALLVWYSHVERVFYALESKRLTSRSGQDVLGVLQDPLVAGLPPRLRTELATVAKGRGISASVLLEEIVAAFLQNRER